MTICISADGCILRQAKILVLQQPSTAVLAKTKADIEKKNPIATHHVVEEHIHQKYISTIPGHN